jgi:hypothetical protein
MEQLWPCLPFFHLGVGRPPLRGAEVCAPERSTLRGQRSVCPKNVLRLPRKGGSARSRASCMAGAPRLFVTNCATSRSWRIRMVDRVDRYRLGTQPNPSQSRESSPRQFTAAARPFRPTLPTRRRESSRPTIDYTISEFGSKRGVLEAMRPRRSTQTPYTRSEPSTDAWWSLLGEPRLHK